jgi:hypothetical protein
MRHATWNTSYLKPFRDTANVWDGNDGTFAHGTIGVDPGWDGTTERAVCIFGGRSTSYIRVGHWDGFPSESGTDTRQVEITYQVVKGGEGGSSGDVGVGDTLGSHGVEVRFEAHFLNDDSNPVANSHAPINEIRLGGNHYPTGTGAYKINQSHLVAYNTDKAVMEQIAASRVTKKSIARLNIPAGYDVSGMMVVASMLPRGDGWRNDGMTKVQTVYTKDNPFDGGEPVEYNVNPMPRNTQTAPTTLRIYDIRLSDGPVQGSANEDFNKVRYCYTEIDRNVRPEPIESAPSPQSETLNFADDAPGAWVYISGGPTNANATHWRIYRSNLNGVDLPDAIPDSLGNFGFTGIEIPVVASGSVASVTDNFNLVPIEYQGTPHMAVVDISADDTTTVSDPRDMPPPHLKATTSFKGSIVGTFSANPRALAYSYAGYPESWPNGNIYDAFPLKENDVLVAPVSLDNVLVILARGAVMSVEELAHFRLGRLVASNVNVIQGAPGCVGDYAYTEFDFQNYPAVAYVSHYGIYACDGHSAVRISDDLDWENEVNVATLKRSTLVYDKEKKHLIFIFDSDGDSVNDSKFIFHMDNIHRKTNNMPKITGPTPAKITDIAVGTVGETYRLFSVGSHNQDVYIESSGLVDQSGSYSAAISGVVPFSVSTGRVYGDWEYWSAIRGNLRHTDWGSETLSMAWKSSRDDTSVSIDTTTKTVALAGIRGTEVFIGRLGEWHQVNFTSATSGTLGGLHHFKVKAQPHGSDAGDV